MARRHSRYVNLYAGGARGPLASGSARVKKFKDRQAELAQNPDYSACPRCGQFYKNPENKHFIDYKNKIRCFEK